MGHTHEDVADRWVNRILHPGRGALSSNNLHDRGDSIFSYGSHFEVARILRDRKGEPRGWLINGNTYSVTTTRHQSAVRNAIGDGHGLPVVTIPHAALDAAGIDVRTIELIDREDDWWSEKVVTKEHLVGKWEYDCHESAPGDYGGWQNTKTGEYVARTTRYGERPPVIECDHEIVLHGPWKPGYNFERDYWLHGIREAHLRARHGAWEEVSPHRRNTGRKSAMMSANIEWELVDEPTAPLGYVFERVIRRHWLGGSLIRAQVPYQATMKHAECGGTGVAAKPWYILSGRGNDGLGPLTQEQAAANQDHWDWQRQRLAQNGWWSDAGTKIEGDVIESWHVDTYAEHTECRGCSGRGRVPVTKRRTAYFLSAFDENETRPSYFFCELPPKVHPTTVTEALETLKPSAVKLAEQAGRDVKRQGDIFAIPMPGVTLRDLKKQGGVHEKAGNLLGTNHQASEVVTLDGQTYARGTIRHVPEWRRPDHRPVTIGREWSLILKNTVPVGA